jgi:hydroxyacylglutathione hydrolase
MIRLEKLVFNSFHVNTYLLYDETKECIIIDSACYEKEEEEALVRYIAEHELQPVLHINTHCHIDHILGMPYVRDKYKIKSHAHESEQKLLTNGHIMGEVFGFHVSTFPELDKHIADSEKITFGNSEIIALHVPGHSEGSLAFYAENEGFVITGDALFDGSIGRTDLPGGNYDQLINSIKNKLLSLPGQTIVWPGHGSSTTIQKEILTNPFVNDLKT